MRTLTPGPDPGATAPSRRTTARTEAGKVPARLHAAEGTGQAGHPARAGHHFGEMRIHPAEGRAPVPPSMGSPLAAGVRARMERVFGADLSPVRVRTDGGLRGRGVRAVTRGELIEVEPAAAGLDSPRDLGLLGHELAHVLQHREGRASTTLPGARGGSAAALEGEAGRAGAAAERGERVPRGWSSPRAAPSAPVAQASAPLADAVAAVRAHGTGTGSTMVTETLVQGIREAEGEFLRNDPLNRLAEGLGMSDTVGPGQLGAPAIASVDANFGTAAAQFAAIHGAAPATWQEKANDPAWSYFYIAAYLAFSINDAEQKFHGTPRTQTNDQIGLLELGIAMYHGAFNTIRDMRRRIATEQGVAREDVTGQMIQEELRSGTATPKEMGLERYTMLARGSFGFSFQITAATVSRRFDVGEGRKVRATILANYSNPAPSPARGTTFSVRLRRREIACHMGACADGFELVSPRFEFTVGTRGRATWTDISPGQYDLHIRKEEATYSPDVLIGDGKVETIF